MSKVEELNKLALKLTGSNPYKKTIKESLESIATYLAGENIEVENIEDAIQKCTEYYSGGGGGEYNAKIEGTIGDDANYGAYYYITEIDLEGVNIKKLNYAFYSFRRLVKVNNINTADATDFPSAFSYCVELTAAPEMDTSKGVDFKEMFKGCSSLVDVPVYNMPLLSNLTKLQNIFSGCTQLSSTSLNNVLKTLLTLTSTSFGSKTLAYIGLTEAQATICTGFDEWAELTTKGWTTGY